jgi:excisionase family DNA binding protein
MSRQQTNPMPTDSTPTAPGLASSTPREVRIHTIRQVADMLGVTVSDVLELIRRGALRARRVGANAVISGDALADFMATHDPAARFPRFTESQPVVLVDEEGQLAFGVFAGETTDGHVVVSRPGFLGPYERAFPPEQVQPVTCRRVAHR